MAKWLIDPDHSVAAFTVRHMMISDVRGQFNKISGELSFDPSDIPNSSVAATIDASGIFTGIQKRDDHLRSPDFFDVANYPQITFKSAKVETAGERRFKITGDLTIHGITRVVSFDAEYSGPEKSPYGDTSIGFSAITRISRADFGMVWNVDLENGGVMVGKEVQILLDIEADLRNA